MIVDVGRQLAALGIRIPNCNKQWIQYVRICRIDVYFDKVFDITG